jgi:hypothetical protein
MVRLGTSEASPWAWTWFQVFRGPEEVWTGEKYIWNTVGHGGPVTVDQAEDRYNESNSGDGRIGFECPILNSRRWSNVVFSPVAVGIGLDKWIG